MKVASVEVFGGPEVLILAEAPAVSASPGDVVIAVEAAGVGLVDTFVRQGAYPGLSEPGVVPGAEVAGTVVAVGDGVGRDWLGRRVYALVRVGGYAEQVAVAVSELAVLPDEVSAVDAVALGINALVAKASLERGGFKEDARVMVRGAGGGIGVMATQMALIRGARVTAISSTEDRAARLRALGAMDVRDRRSADGIAGEFDLIIDPVAGAEVGAFVARLQANGRYVICGVAGGPPSPDFGMSLFSAPANSLTISFLSLDSFTANQRIAMIGDVFELAVKGSLKPIVEQVYPLAEASSAHKHLETGKVFGKLVIVP